jgi:hypothetical protein
MNTEFNQIMDAVYKRSEEKRGERAVLIVIGFLRWHRLRTETQGDPRYSSERAFMGIPIEVDEKDPERLEVR